MNPLNNQKNDEPRSPYIYRVKSPHGWEFEATSIEGHALALAWFDRLKELPYQPIAAQFSNAFASSNPIPFGQPTSSVLGTPEGKTMLVSQWVEDYLKYLPTSSKLNDKGRMEAKSSLNLFVAITGDKPLGALTTRDGQTFVSTLQKWPAHSSKKPEFRDLLSPKDILLKAKELDAPCLSSVTVLNRTGYVQGFFSWLQKRQEIHFDPFYGVVLPDAVAKLIRHPFSPEDIAIIFNPEKRVWADTPHQYWAPILSYYTGARVREIGQLHTADVEIILGFPVIHVAERFPGQQVKTDGSERVIPLRKEILDLGFLDYVKDIEAMGHTLLFPGTVWTNGDPGRPISRPFNETYLRGICAITEPGKSFHCFRHLFSDQAERSGLSDGRISQLTGHKLENVSALRTNYIQATTLPQRNADIHAISLPSIDIEKYRPGQFNRYFRDIKRKEHRAKLRENEEKKGSLEESKEEAVG